MDVKDQNQLEKFKAEISKLHARHELAGNTSDYYFEPGMMEYLDQSEGILDEETGKLLLRFEARGTRYEGRTEQIEKVKLHDEIRITRDAGNSYNGNNFRLLTSRGKDVGNMPAELCDALAPLYDSGYLMIESAHVSYVEPISQRSRYAKQAVLFVEMSGVVSAAASSTAWKISSIISLPENEDSENAQKPGSIFKIAEAPFSEVENLLAHEETAAEEFETSTQIFEETLPQSITSEDELTTDEGAEDSYSRYQNTVHEWRKACIEIRRKQVEEGLNLLEQMKTDHLDEIAKLKQDAIDEQKKIICELQEEMIAAKSRISSLSFFKFQEKKRLRARMEQIELEINAAKKEEDKTACEADIKVKQTNDWINNSKQEVWKKVTENYPLDPMPRAQETDNFDEGIYDAILDRYAVLDTIAADTPFTIDYLLQCNPQFACRSTDQMNQLLQEMADESLLLCINNGERESYMVSTDQISFSILPQELYQKMLSRQKRCQNKDIISL